MTLLVMLFMVTTTWADEVNYYDPTAAGEQTKQADATAIISQTSLGTSGETTWYYVSGTVSVTSRIEVKGTVNLILADDCAFTAENGIHVADGNNDNKNKLNIYAQSYGNDEHCGKLVAHSNTSGDAAIGGNSGQFGNVAEAGEDAGAITIYGGNITAHGDIGGGHGGVGVSEYLEPGTGGHGGDATVTIHGGNIKVNGTIGGGAGGIGDDSGEIEETGGYTDSDGVDGSPGRGTVIIGWTNITDRIYAQGYLGLSYDSSESSYIEVAKGKAFMVVVGDETILVNGQFSDLSAIERKTLQPVTKTYIQTNLGGDDRDGSEDSPYVISTLEGWNAFCIAMEDDDWNNFEGKIIQLGADIVETPVTRMAGSENQNHPFRGTFDGQNKTLYVRYGNSVANYFMQDNAAPFAYVGNGCVIKNLHTTGSIYTIRNRAAGIVAMQNGGSTVTISNCSSNVYILSIGGEDDGPRCHGGLVAYQENSDNTILTIDNCKFYGKICSTGSPYTTGCGGLVGFKGDASTLTIKNCLYAPAALSEGETEPSEGCATLARRTDDHNLTIIDSYYTRDLSDPQGTQVYTTEEVNGALAGGAHDCYVKAYTFRETDYYAKTVITLSGLKTKMKTGTEYSLVVKEGEKTLTYGSTTDQGDYGPVLYAPASGGSPTEVFPTTVGDYTVSVQLKGNYRGVITMDFELVDSWPFSGDGTEDSPYIIKYKSDLDFFVTMISEGTDTDKYYKLADSWDNTDNPLTRMAGTADYKFCGHFDGNGKTLYVSYGTKASLFLEDNAAPFRYTDGATIQNLHVAGTIYIDGKHAAGIIANHYGTGTISNCRSSVIINSRTWGECNHGGIVGMVADNSSACLTIEGCVFDGKILNMGNTTQCGGLVGFKSASATLTITNSIYAPAALSEGETEPTTNCATLSCPVDGTYTFTNSFYTRTLGTAQGYDYSFDHHYDAPNNFGTVGTPYSVSDITPYTRGILYGGKYYKAPQAVSLIDDAENNLDGIHGYFADVTLSGRKLYKEDGDWNTFCVPFDVKVAGSPLEGATIMELNCPISELTNGTLTLNFVDVTESIDAGRPYIVKWDDGSDVENPVFKGVTISKILFPVDTSDRKVTFMGCYDYQRFDSDDQSILFLGDRNTLYWPKAGASIGACRAYFKVNGGDNVRAFKLNFTNEEVMGIKDMNDNRVCPSEDWYTLDGRKIGNGTSPDRKSHKGIFISKGRKVVVK